MLHHQKSLPGNNSCSWPMDTARKFTFLESVSLFSKGNTSKYPRMSQPWRSKVRLVRPVLACCLGRQLNITSVLLDEEKTGGLSLIYFILVIKQLRCVSSMWCLKLLVLSCHTDLCLFTSTVSHSLTQNKKYRLNCRNNRKIAVTSISVPHSILIKDALLFFLLATEIITVICMCVGVWVCGCVCVMAERTCCPFRASPFSHS